MYPRCVGLQRAATGAAGACEAIASGHTVRPSGAAAAARTRSTTSSVPLWRGASRRVDSPSIVPSYRNSSASGRSRWAAWGFGMAHAAHCMGGVGMAHRMVAVCETHVAAWQLCAQPRWHGASCYWRLMAAGIKSLGWPVPEPMSRVKCLSSQFNDNPTISVA